MIPSVLFNGISLIYFCVYLNTSSGDCYASNNGTTEQGLNFDPAYVVGGGTFENVTGQMHILIACGISLCVFHLFNDVVVLAVSEKMLPIAIKIKALTFIFTLVWLIAGTIFRFQWSGRVCSGEFGSEPFYL